MGGPQQRMPSNNLYESDVGDKDDKDYVPAANSALLQRRRPMHGKMTAAILGGSVCLNAMLVLYCVNMQFMKPLPKCEPAPPPASFSSSPPLPLQQRTARSTQGCLFKLCRR